jgi:hypothetical protein
MTIHHACPPNLYEQNKRRGSRNCQECIRLRLMMEPLRNPIRMLWSMHYYYNTRSAKIYSNHLFGLPSSCKQSATRGQTIKICRKRPRFVTLILWHLERKRILLLFCWKSWLQNKYSLWSLNVSLYFFPSCWNATLCASSQQPLSTFEEIASRIDLVVSLCL